MEVTPLPCLGKSDDRLLRFRPFCAAHRPHLDIFQDFSLSHLSGAGRFFFVMLRCRESDSNSRRWPALRREYHLRKLSSVKPHTAGQRALALEPQPTASAVFFEIARISSAISSNKHGKTSSGNGVAQAKSAA